MDFPSDRPQKIPTYITNIYQLPSGNVNAAINIIKSKITDIHGISAGDILLLGDINIDLKTKAADMPIKYQRFLSV